MLGNQYVFISIAYVFSLAFGYSSIIIILTYSPHLPSYMVTFVINNVDIYVNVFLRNNKSLQI